MSFKKGTQKNIIKGKVLIIALSVSVLGVLMGLSHSTILAQSDKDSSYIVQKKYVNQELSLSGSINAYEDVVLRFPASGKLTWVGVKEGDYVQKGQGIASQDARELQKKLKKYLNTYKSTRDSFDQAKDDYETKSMSDVTQLLRDKASRLLDQSQMSLNNAVIDVELQTIANEAAYLSSPIEGIVVRVGAPYSGVNVTPAQAEFEIINPNSFYFSALADQTDVVNITNNLRGTIVLDSYPDKKFSGSVQTIALTPKEGESGTVYEVKVMLNQINTNYRIGMTGDVTFTTSKKDEIIRIPAKYIKTENSKQFVYKKQNAKKIKEFIKTGEKKGNMTEVTSGLKAGDTIYISDK